MSADHMPGNEHADASIRRLMGWYRPFLTHSYGLLTLTLVGVAAVLTAQALTPLQVESLLHHEHWDTRGFLILLFLVLVQLIVGHFVGLGAHEIGSRFEVTLRARLFERLLSSRALRRDHAGRSGLIHRFTTDPAVLADALTATIHAGLPGVVRVILSLTLLTFIDWRAGVVMTIATIGFLAYRWLLRRGMQHVDDEASKAFDHIGDIVDESVVSSRLISSLGLENWAKGRFTRRINAERHATHEQGIVAVRFESGARTAGLAGLVAVVAFALVAGGSSLAAVAAALLYVEGVVAGLETLPGWIRTLHVAAVARTYVDTILVDDEPEKLLSPALAALRPERLSGDAVDVPPQFIALVTPSGMDDDLVLTALSGSADPSDWRSTLDGFDVRMPGIGPDVMHVPSTTSAFDVSIAEFMSAKANDITEDEIRHILAVVGLDHIEALVGGLDQPIGPLGAALTVSERQRLALASAVAAQPDRLLVGPLIALADPDSALPLVAGLRQLRGGATVLSASTRELAEALDLALFVSPTAVHLGTHRELLEGVPEYAETWQNRLSTADIDLSVLGLEEDDTRAIYARLVTEHYAPGEVVYREGSPADRIVFVIKGRVEITSTGADGRSRRVAVHGPGNHCGDLTLTVGERRAESAIALDDVVVRTLSREAISAGMVGLLDRPHAERQIVAAVLRNGRSTRHELREMLASELSGEEFDAALALLIRDGAVRLNDDVVSVTQRRTVKGGMADLLDRLS